VILVQIEGQQSEHGQNRGEAEMDLSPFASAHRGA
jgi:hypothetical protein